MGAGKIKVGNIYFNIRTCKVGYAINIHPSMLMYSEFKIIVLFMQFQKFSFFFYDYVIVHQGAVVYISRKPMICASTKPWHIVFFSQNCTSLVLRFKVKVKKKRFKYPFPFPFLFFFVGESCASVMAELNGKIWPSSGVDDQYHFLHHHYLK